MAIFYHCLYSGLGYDYVAPGSSYQGSDRGHLSELLGGLVGFAYAYLPKSWRGSPTYNMYEVLIPDDAVVFLGKDYHDVPRDEDQDWDEYCILVTAKEAVQLCSKEGHTFTEVAFLASDVVFDKPLIDLKRHMEIYLDAKFSTHQEALKAGVDKVLSLGLKEKELRSMYTNEPFIGLNLPYPCEDWVDLIHGYALHDFDSVEEWLTNKPHWVTYLLGDRSWVEVE